MDIKLEILMGLPGSGKTTFAKEREKKYFSQECMTISLDDINNCKRYGRKVSLDEKIGELLSGKLKKTTKCIIVDGLILTNEDLFNVITAIAPRFGKVDVVVYQWNEDRDTCLKNDGGRRELPSANTILYAKYEVVNVEEINEKIKDWDASVSKVVKKDVILKEGWERYFRHIAYVDEDKKLRSGRWCTGGAYGNCWDSHLSPVSGEDPLEFKALDDLLESIAPNITFLHYKKIRSECVNTEETYERDYYGGGCSYLNWVCDLEKLYAILEEKGYIS
jgi:predicted kinase